MQSFVSVIYAVLLVLYAAICGLGRLTIAERKADGEQKEKSFPVFSIGFYGILWLWVVVCILFGGFLCVLPLLSAKAAASLKHIQLFNMSVLAVGCLGGLVMSKTVRRWFASWMPLHADSPMHHLALIGLFPFMGIFVSSLLMTTPEKLIESMKNVDILTSSLEVQLLFVAITVISIGWGFARNHQQALSRLGFRKLTWKEVGIAIGLAFGMFVFLSFVLDPVLRHFLPTDTKFQETIMELTKPGKATGNVPLEIILVSLMAGIGEEMFFRGLLLPIVGLFPSALLFALIHVQYGLGSGIVIVMCSGLILGWIRQRYGIVASMITHAAYDILALTAVSYLMKSH